MNKLIPLAAVLLLLLGGCAGKYHRAAPCACNSDTVTDAVSVSGDQIKLAEEVILVRATPDGSPVTIVWKLNPADGYRFTKQGIVIEGRLLDQVVRGEPPAVALDPRQQEIGNCIQADDAGYVFSCSAKPTRIGVYKYTIRLIKGDNVISRDPPIVLW